MDTMDTKDTTDTTNKTTVNSDNVTDEDNMGSDVISPSTNVTSIPETVPVNTLSRDDIINNLYQNMYVQYLKSDITAEGNDITLQRFNWKARDLQSRRNLKMINKLRKSSINVFDENLVKEFFEKEQNIFLNEERKFPFTYLYKKFDPIPLLKIKHKEIYPMKENDWISVCDITLRQNIYWIKSGDDGNCADIHVVGTGQNKEYFARITSNWVVNYKPILSKYYCWCPENVLPVLAQIVNSYRPKINLIGVNEAREYVNSLWNKDLEERKKDPDNFSKIEVVDEEQQTLFDSLIVLIVIRDPFIKSNKVLDLYKYIPFPSQSSGYNYECKALRSLHKYGLARKIYPYLSAVPVDESSKIEQRLKRLRVFETAHDVYNELLTEFQNILDDIYKAYNEDFKFIIPDLMDRIIESENNYL